MDNKIKFSVEKIKGINLEKDSRFAILDIDICRSGNNHNDIPFTRNSIENAVETLYPNPVLFKINKNNTNFMGHEEDEEIGGSFLYNTANTFERDGELWINAKAAVYKTYCPHIVDILSKKENETDVSMEITVKETVNINGKEYVDKFEFNGVTLLGVEPAIPKAKAKMISFSTLDNVSKEYYKEVFMRSKYEDLDMSIPKSVKDCVLKFLNDFKEEKYQGISKSSLAVARFLSSNDKIDIKRLEKMNDFFMRYTNDRYQHNEKSYACHGGDDGKKWIFNLMKKFNEINSNIQATFSKSLKIDKSAEKMSNKPWGEVDKTELRNKVMDAENSDSIVKSVYLLVEDGYKESPSEKLKYPVMEIDGDTLVYNRNGLSSALAYARKENESSVVDKVLEIYKKLGIDDESKKGEKEKMNKIYEKTSESETFSELQGREIYNAVIKEVQDKLGKSFYVKTIYDDHIIVENEEDDKSYHIDADIKAKSDDEDMKIDIKWDSKKEIDSKSNEEDDDDNDEYFALFDFNELINKDLEDLNEDDMEVYFKDFAKNVENLSKVNDEDIKDKKFEKVADLACKLARLVEKYSKANTKMMAKYNELKKFKKEEEDKQKQFIVDSTMATVKDKIDSNEFNNLLEESKECSFANINGWVNKVKSFAYDKITKDDTHTENFQRYSFGNSFVQKQEDSLWK